MISLVMSEMAKLKRNHIVMFTLVAAFIFPVLLSILASHTGMSFEKLRMFIFIFSFYVLLPIFSSLVLATLIFEERDNQTLKNILSIPVPRGSLLGAKMCLILLIGIIYAMISLILPVGMAVINNDISLLQVLKTFGLGIMISLMVVLGNSPMLLVVLKLSKNYLMTFIISLFYTIISFIFSLQYMSIPLPLSVVMKWSLPHISTGPQDVTRFFFSTSSCVGILLVVTIISCWSAFAVFRHEEV